MTKRRAITERMKIGALLFHFDLRCRICFERMGPHDKIEWDHMTALALGGEHDYKNIAPIHKFCHDKKTFGLRSTTAGSDIGKIAKAKRIAKTGKMTVTRTIYHEPGRPITVEMKLPSRDKPKRIWPSRPIPSRGFQKVRK